MIQWSNEANNLWERLCLQTKSTPPISLNTALVFFSEECNELLERTWSSPTADDVSTVAGKALNNLDFGTPFRLSDLRPEAESLARARGALEIHDVDLIGSALQKAGFYLEYISAPPPVDLSVKPDTSPEASQAVEETRTAPDPEKILLTDEDFFRSPYIDPTSDVFREHKQSILAMKIAAHETDFDEDLFLDLIAASISLTVDEKHNIVLAIPRLTQFQIDQLITILTDEQAKYRELQAKHLSRLQKPENKRKSPGRISNEGSNRDEAKNAVDDLLNF